MTPSELSVKLLLKNPHWIRRLARRLVRDDHAVDDIVQQTYLAALERPPRSPATLTAWLRSVVHNLVRLEFRGRIRREGRERRVARPETTPSTADLCEARDIQRQLVELVLELREPYQSTVLRRYFHDWSTARIAQEDDVSPEAVRQRLHRAHVELAQRLEARESRDGRGLLLLALLADGDSRYSVSRLRRVAAILLVALAVMFFTWPPGEATAPPRSRISEVFPEPSLEGVRVARAAPALARNESGVTPTSAGVDNAAPLPLTAHQTWLRVVDAETGQPVPDARVMLGVVRLDSRRLARGRSAMDVLFRRHVTDWAGSRTDAAGGLRVLRDRLRREQLTIRAPGYAELREPARLRRFADEYRVSLSPAPLAQVRVVDELGAPVPAVHWESFVGDTRRGSGVTDAVGQFEYRYEDAALALVIAHPGCAVISTLAELPDQTVTLVAGEICYGRVVDDDGQPLADCRVQVRSSTEARPTRVFVTGADGRFSTRRVALDGWVTLEISHDDHVALRSKRIPRWHGVHDVQLARSTEVHGTVYDSEGRCLPGATVRLVPDGQSFYSRDLPQSSSAGDGTFRARQWRQGSHWLVVEHDDHATSFFTVAREGTAEAATVAALLAPGRTVRGSVTGEQDQPVAGVRLQLGWVCGDEIRGPIVETDEQGGFVFRDVPRSVPALQPALRDRRWKFLLDDAGRLPVDTLLVEVLRPHELLRSGRHPVPGDGMFGSRNTLGVGPQDFELQLVVAPTDASRAPLLALTDADGREVRTLSNLLIVPREDIAHETDIVFGGMSGNPVHLHGAGALEGCLLVIISRRYAVGLREVDAGADEWPLPVTLHERRATRFELHVKDATGMPVAGAALFAAPFLDHREPFAAIYIGHTDDSGSLRTGELPPGQYRIGIPAEDPPPVSTRRFTAARAVEELQMLGSIGLAPDGPERIELTR